MSKKNRILATYLLLTLSPVAHRWRDCLPPEGGVLWPTDDRFRMRAQCQVPCRKCSVWTVIEYELWNLHWCLEWFLHFVHKLHFADSGWASQQAIESGVEVLAANQVWHFPDGNVSAIGQHSQTVRSQHYLSDRKRAGTFLRSPKSFPWHLLV